MAETAAVACGHVTGVHVKEGDLHPGGFLGGDERIHIAIGGPEELDGPKAQVGGTLKALKRRYVGDRHGEVDIKTDHGSASPSDDGPG